jgi:carboxymethylenebutenolidase
LRSPRHGSLRRLTPCKAVFAPAPDLNALWDNHIATEFTEKSADAAVATMVPHATVNHVPTMTGGVGTEALRAFYADNFIPKMPDDVILTPIDRTIAKDTIVDEFIFEFTHNTIMDWMLPGIAPTGKKVKVPFVVVVKFEGDKVGRG